MEMVVVAATPSLSKVCASTLRRISSATLRASDLTDNELAEQVSVGVVYLLEAVYVSHKHAQGSSLVGHRLEAVLEFAVEASLGEEAREVVAVHELVQLFEE
jgi:hypothetical protein